MAVDTRNKRMSMIGIFLPVPRVAPEPDNSVDSIGDFEQWLMSYAGVDFNNPTPSGNRWMRWAGVPGMRNTGFGRSW